MSGVRKPMSISSRLTRMNLLVSFVVLLLAALAFFTYDLISFRDNLIQNVKAQAEIVGDTTVTSLVFNDPLSASAALQSLQNAPDVVGAVIRLDNGGAIFARYGAVSPPQKSAIHVLAPGETDRWWPSTNSRVLVAHRVTFEGKTVGVVYIVASLQEMHRRARRYALIAGAILLLCMAAGLLVSSTAQRLIATPIRGLAETATKVTQEQDYTVRADADVGSSEIAALVGAFNGMLSQIQERDAALTEARDQLEARVEERTAELQAANRELEAFSYTVAHDLRGPLDAITGIVFLLANSKEMAGEASGDEMFMAMLEQLKTSTGNMAGLIDDLLNFARASTSALKSEPVNISALARGIVEDLHRSEPDRDVHFVIAELPMVNSDEGLLRIVLDNLLRNAWKYTSHHKSALIEFGGKVHGEGLIYFVRDDGAGFDSARKDKLFHPFQRLHSKGEFPGTGIGLATVERILGRMGGRIWAEGQVEVGAAFYFTL